MTEQASVNGASHEAEPKVVQLPQHLMFLTEGNMVLCYLSKDTTDNPADRVPLGSINANVVRDFPEIWDGWITLMKWTCATIYKAVGVKVHHFGSVEDMPS